MDIVKINCLTAYFTVILDWSFKKLFGRNLATSCPLASTSKIYVDISSNKVQH